MKFARFERGGVITIRQNNTHTTHKHTHNGKERKNKSFCCGSISCNNMVVTLFASSSFVASPSS